MKHDRPHSPPPGQVGFPRMWKRALALAAGAGTLLFVAHQYSDSYYKWRDEGHREYSLELSPASVIRFSGPVSLKAGAAAQMQRVRQSSPCLA